MPIPSSLTDMQALSKTGLTTEKLPQHIYGSIIKHKAQKHSENMYTSEDHKSVPKHLVILMEESILIGITN